MLERGLLCSRVECSSSMVLIYDIIIISAKKDCEACDVLEKELTVLREDLVDALNAWVVKAVSSSMVKLYNPAKEPALVFFRHGVPLLYDG